MPKPPTDPPPMTDSYLDKLSNWTPTRIWPTAMYWKDGEYEESDEGCHAVVVGTAVWDEMVSVIAAADQFLAGEYGERVDNGLIDALAALKAKVASL